MHMQAHDSETVDFPTVAGWAPHGAAERLPEFSESNATEQQIEVLGEIFATRGGSLAGPFLSWIHSPTLASHAQRLGAFCRYHTGLPPRLSELAILVTAQRWQAHAEWQIHCPIARATGLPDHVIDSIRSGAQPDFEDLDDALVYRFASELYNERRVSDKTYSETVARWGETVIINLVGLLGYYALVAMTLNVFNVTLQGSPQTP